ncbi:agmatinase [Pleionea mediterranea]|uniref:Agmatinase n=1 Tax=Pleionea mediterranea TaxID=523701 RepID=A0A316FY60_9GAMM|nr:agmatinase [Pleionea mediterranea]PWK53312.1 agmatinase [Pleionea mediterranea]
MSTLANSADLSLYANAFGFLRQPLNFNPMNSQADVVVLGFPFDMATTGRAGARMGPGAIRRASTNLCWEEKRWPWSFKLCDNLTIEDAGDLVFEPGDAEAFTEQAEALITPWIQSNKTLLSLGGDHFITLPLLRAHHKMHGEMALIHFDAHTDTYSQGSRFDHGTMFYHAPKEGLISTEHSIQLGIRTEYDTSDHGFKVLSADQLNELSVDSIIEQIKTRVGDKPVYLTFDIDCLDPAFAPGTGTPVCGGLSTNKVLQIIRGLVGVNLIGMDVVEVSPPYDSADISALAGATLALEMLYVVARNKQSV